MSLMLRLQILTIAAVALTIPFVRVSLGAVASERDLLIHNVAVSAFLTWWSATIAIRRLRGVADDTPDGWYPHTLQVFWLGNLAVVTASWAVMPPSPPTLRLLNVVFCMCPVVVEIIGTVRNPAYGRRGWAGTLAPLGIPAGLCAWYLQSGDPLGAAVVFIFAAFVLVLLLLREFLQSTVDAAYLAKAEAEAGRDARARFLAAASHDLGQPLQAARLFFDQATRARSTAARRTAEARVDWAFGAMEQQLRQILDHLMLDARELTPALTEVDAGAVFARVAELHEPGARLAGAQIVALPTTLRVRGDAAYVERALSNLIANAVRHAGARRILLGARRRGERVRIWVIDDGRGVPDTDIGRLFDEFAQGEWADRGDVRGGFGLGLASARRMAQQMGGDVGHDGRWRRGAAFWLELPRAASQASG